MEVVGLNLTQGLKSLSTKVVDVTTNLDPHLIAEAKGTTDTENTEVIEADQEKKKIEVLEGAHQEEAKKTMVKRLRDRLQKKEEL